MNGQFGLLLSFILCCSGVVKTVACDCIKKATVENAVRNSSLVVIGTVLNKVLVAVTDNHQIVPFSDEDSKRNTFRYTTILSECKVLVEVLYKGTISSDTLTIFTGTGEHDCGMEFNADEKYIIYSSVKTYSKQKYNDLIYSLGKNIFWTDRCTRTTKYSIEEVTEIRKYEKEKALNFKK